VLGCWPGFAVCAFAAGVPAGFFGVVAAGAPLAAPWDGGFTWCGCGTPNVWAIDSVRCCSGSGSAPAALSPQLASVPQTATNTNAARRGRGSFARVFANRGVASSCSSNTIMSMWLSTTSSRGITRSSARRSASTGDAARASSPPEPNGSLL